MKDSYYFSHDSNAKDDPKCVLLIEQLGLEGYGIFWVLIETLRDQPSYRYPIKLIGAIARRFNTTTEKVKTVVLNYELFSLENEEFFFSPSLINRMELHDRIKRSKSLAAKKGNEVRWGKLSHSDHAAITDGSHTDCKSIANGSDCIARIGEDRIGEDNDRKGKERIENTQPFEIFLKKENINTSENFEFITSQMWFDTKAMQLGCEVSEISERAKDFLIDVRDRDLLEGKTLIDLRSHFVSWFKNKKKQETINQVKKANYLIPEFSK